ncbi:transposable element Tcb1 transposase [Trichonephila clavipes]|nr:transposable element Tcb1 transposase [Trichonephila clavipes]
MVKSQEMVVVERFNAIFTKQELYSDGIHRSNHWEAGGRTQCDKCACRVRIAHSTFHDFETLKLHEQLSGFSSGRPRGTTPADDRYNVLQARRNRWQTAGEFARHTTQATGRPISRFTVARRLHGGDLFARRPVRYL